MQFLSQFLLNIHYKLGWFNIVPDILSKLPSNNIIVKEINLKFNELDGFYAYNTTLVKMNKVFVAKICKEYKDDLMWNKTKRGLKVNCLLGLNTIDLLFEFGYAQPNSILPILSLLIFYKDKFSGQRHLYVLQSCLGDLFKILHDRDTYPNFVKIFDLVQ